MLASSSGQQLLLCCPQRPLPSNLPPPGHAVYASDHSSAMPGQLASSAGGQHRLIDTSIYQSVFLSHRHRSLRGLCCRLAVFRAFEKSGEDMKVGCTNKALGGKHESFSDMLTAMEHSIFCLVLPGDSPSVRRLSEVFLAGAPLQAAGWQQSCPELQQGLSCQDAGLTVWQPAVSPAKAMSGGLLPAGCIPVFVGAPWAAMPLANAVDYGSVALFFNMTGPTPWLKKEDAWKMEVPEQPLPWMHQTPLNIIQVHLMAVPVPHCLCLPANARQRQKQSEDPFCSHSSVPVPGPSMDPSMDWCSAC